MAKYLPRNHLAIVARQRNGGPMKHRNTPRGGARKHLYDADDVIARDEWSGLCDVGLHGLDYEGQECDRCAAHEALVQDEIDEGLLATKYSSCN